MIHPGIPPEYINQIVTGDARELAKRLPDESVDLIFTDPPYPRDYLYLFQWLADEAPRILKSGGSCLVLSGTAYFNQVFRWFDEKLNYYWMNCYYLPTVTATGRFWPRKIYQRWKPVLWFVKDVREPVHFVQDGVSGAYNDKRFHEWGQDEQWAFYWLDQLAEEETIIFDPFVGGGTVPAVCKILRRNYVAFEIDPLTARRARERVANTQTPLFTMEPQQAVMPL